MVHTGQGIFNLHQGIFNLHQGSWNFDILQIRVFLSTTGQVGLGVGSWPSNRGIESQGNPITQECRQNNL